MAQEKDAADIDRMLEAALGGMTPQEHLLEQSRAEAADPAAKAEAIARNRARALELLAVIEKNLK